MFVVYSAGVTFNHPLLKQLNELWKLGFQQMVASHKHLFQHFFQLTERIYAITMTGQNLDSDKHIRDWVRKQVQQTESNPELWVDEPQDERRWEGFQSSCAESVQWTLRMKHMCDEWEKTTVNRPLIHYGNRQIKGIASILIQQTLRY